MMLRRLRIEHFRGIDAATWSINRRLVALVGAGDSTKSTLLDAIGLVLSPSYSPQLTDADFYNFDLTKAIVIEAVVTDFPDNLIKEGQLGKDRSGLMPDGTLVHDPLDDAEECLVIRLTVTSDLEPTWEVVRPDSEDTRPISASQRRQLGFFRLGERPDFHFRWARGSALSGLTDGRDGASSVILEAHRKARTAVFDSEPNALHKAATAAQDSASAFGAAAFSELRPGLEPGSSSSTHALLLHDGDVPLSSRGLGTRRLTSLAIQDRAMQEGSIIAIDEVEHGLEPHRLVQAIYHLRQRTAANELQVIMTTHSPTAVTTLEAKDIEIVRADGYGKTTCRSVPPLLNNVQGTLRSAPDALLGRRVIVAEGATEVGVLRALLRHWDERRLNSGMVSAAAVGVVLVDGHGGAQAIQRAINFNELGYPTCVLLDNDDSGVQSHVDDAERAGIKVLRWGHGYDIEHEIINALPLTGVQEVINLAVNFRGEKSVRDSVAKGTSAESLTGVRVDGWITQASEDEKTLRSAIADAAVARDKEWFKRQDRGEDLAGVIISHKEDLAGTHLAEILTALRAFAYDENPEPIPTDKADPSFDE